VIEELADGLWRWTARHPEWHPGAFGSEVAAYALRAGDVTLLVDPIAPRPELLDDVVNGEVAILITVPYHARDAEPLAERYGATVHGHPAVAKRLESRRSFRPAEPGDELPGGARPYAIGRPRRYEMPLWLPSHRAVAFGDAVVETGAELRIWAQGPAGERHRRFLRERFAPTLEPLVELAPERVLVTHGRPVLSGGAAALRRAVSGDPWWLTRGQ
jgi:hypothetical protein